MSEEEKSIEELNNDRFIAECMTSYSIKALHNLNSVEKRQKITGTIQHEVNEAKDKIDFVAEMGRWSTQAAESKKKIKVTGKKRGPDRTVEE